MGKSAIPKFKVMSSEPIKIIGKVKIRKVSSPKKDYKYLTITQKQKDLKDISKILDQDCIIKIIPIKKSKSFNTVGVRIPSPKRFLSPIKNNKEH